MFIYINHVPRKRKSHLISASDVLQSLLQSDKSPIVTQFTRWKLWYSWEKVVGESLAKFTTPVGYLRGQLYVWVNHPTRMQELTFIAGTMRDQINSFIGRKWVRSVRFTLDRRSVPEQAEMSEEWRNFLSKSPPPQG